MTWDKLEEGEYTTSDGKRVSFTDQETLRDVADLYAVVDGEYNGTASTQSETLKHMLAGLQAGMPLSAAEWEILHRIKQRYEKELEAFRNSPDNEEEGYIPLHNVDAGRIMEALPLLERSRPSLAQVREGQPKPPPNLRPAIGPDRCLRCDMYVYPHADWGLCSGYSLTDVNEAWVCNSFYLDPHAPPWPDLVQIAGGV